MVRTDSLYLVLQRTCNPLSLVTFSMEKCTEHVLSLRHLLKCLKAPPKFSCSVCVSQTLGLVGMCASRNRYRHFWLHSFYWFGIFFLNNILEFTWTQQDRFPDDLI